MPGSSRVRPFWSTSDARVAREALAKAAGRYVLSAAERRHRYFFGFVFSPVFFGIFGFVGPDLVPRAPAFLFPLGCGILLLFFIAATLREVRTRTELTPVDLSRFRGNADSPVVRISLSEITGLALSRSGHQAWLDISEYGPRQRRLQVPGALVDRLERAVGEMRVE